MKILGFCACQRDACNADNVHPGVQDVGKSLDFVYCETAHFGSSEVCVHHGAQDATLKNPSILWIVELTWHFVHHGALNAGNSWVLVD